MNQKQIGYIIIAIGLLVAAMVTANKAQEDVVIDALIEAQNGTCFINGGKCLHQDRDYTSTIAGYVLSSALVILGLYLVFFDTTQKILVKQHEEVSKALKEASHHNTEKEKFTAFLSGFSEDEKTVIKAIKEQEGIQQSTLRYRTGMSKAALSLMLKDFVDRNLITKKQFGKTNKLFLRKKF